MKKIYLIIWLVVVGVFFDGCATKRVKKAEIKKEPSLEYFVAKHSKSMFSKVNQHRLNANFRERYFKAWNIEKFYNTKKFATWGLRAIQHRNFYGENKKLLSKKFIQKLNENSNFEKFDTLKLKAITIDNTSLKVFPSHKPFYKKKNSFPFDFNQNSSLYVNHPLFVSHYSKDKAWVFVQSSFTTGWLPIKDVAFVDDNFAKEFQNSKIAVITKENTPIYDKLGNFLYYTKTATMFPIFKNRLNDYFVYIATKNPNLYASLDIVKIDKNSANIQPLPFVKTNIAKIANSLIDEKYGWGGDFFNRDCSTLTRDFFIPFGIWLPRNSYTQSRYLKYINLSKLKPKEKENFILKNAIPFETLIYLKGHIMLYIGEFENQAFVMHNTWGGGVKLKNNKKIIYGKSIISNLYLGSHIESVDKNNLLIHKILGISLVEPNFILNR